VAPIVSAAGLDLDEVVIRSAGRRSLVRVVVDADGGVALDTVAAISQEISDAIDAANVMGETSYTLEVSSPGVDRPLTEPKHWRRAKDRLVEITDAQGQVVTGRIRSSADTGVTLEVRPGKPGTIKTVERRFDYADLERAVVQVEFNPAGGAELAELDETVETVDGADELPEGE
jgi:ribosome maturation factor RimP